MEKWGVYAGDVVICVESMFGTESTNETLLSRVWPTIQPLPTVKNSQMHCKSLYLRFSLASPHECDKICSSAAELFKSKGEKDERGDKS